ncbi:phosphatidylserine decarboxylase [Sulfurimonas sp.]
MNNNLFILHQHSRKYVGFSFAVLIVFLFLDLNLFALVTFIFMAFAIYSFRNPEKSFFSYEKNSVASPVDGTIIAVEEIEDSEYSFKVDIYSSYMDVSFLRVPFDSKIESINLVRGARLSKNSKLFESLNEYAHLVLVDDNKNKVKIEHKLTRSFAPLFIDIALNDNVKQTTRYGLMLNGVTTLYLPSSFRLDVSIGNKVSASETLLGYFSS